MSIPTDDFERFDTPANGSRFFQTYIEATNESTGTVVLSWDYEDPFLFNPAFDPSRILYDSNYCTGVADLNGATALPTLDYFPSVLQHFDQQPTVCDIGCGQGEFVEVLRKDGFSATGFDPALRQASPYLRPRLWQPQDEAADLYVMRCVLPHIPDPWDFVRSLAESSPSALLLVEYQSIDWILEQDMWFLIGHGHVNYFELRDFESRFTVVDSGSWAGGEWGWVLIQPSSYVPAPPREFANPERLRSLLTVRRNTLAAVRSQKKPIALWGAAGKGIILGHALQEAGAMIVGVIDSNPTKWGTFLELSGIPVLSPTQALGGLPKNTLILVCNPNHFDVVAEIVGETYLVWPANRAWEIK